MQPTTFDLSGRTAIVTGAGRGIGRACALALAANGANVVLASRTQAQIDAVHSEIKEGGGRGLALAADVTSKEETKALAAETIAAFGSIDILVNNAGTFIMKPLVPTAGQPSQLADMVPGFDDGFTDEDWYKTLDTNVTSVFRCCQAVAPQMIAQKYGRIINISSVDADHGLRFAAAYCASKGAIKSMTKALAKEWVRFNITVNCVAPGYTDTDLFPPVMHNEEIKAATAKQNIPMRRFAEPAEIAVPVVYLASDHASYVTGESIYIDGGVLA